MSNSRSRWSCAASYLFANSHTAEYPMARSGLDSVRAAGVASSLIRNTGVKGAWERYMIRDLLSDVQIMLVQTACAAYIHNKALLVFSTPWEGHRGAGQAASESNP
eukprot:1161688-Pelagomonas_calceolata.AAC.11